MCREFLITENIKGISLIFDIFIGKQNKIRLMNSRAFLTMRMLDNSIAKILCLRIITVRRGSSKNCLLFFYSKRNIDRLKL